MGSDCFSRGFSDLGTLHVKISRRLTKTTCEFHNSVTVFGKTLVNTLFIYFYDILHHS